MQNDNGKVKESAKESRNAGFSLVELIVAIGLLSIVSLMVFTFMSTSSNSYVRVSAESEVQKEAQLVANAISDIIVDCAGAIQWYADSETEKTFSGGGLSNIENALVIRNADKEHLIYLKADDSQLIYLTRDADVKDSGEYLASSYNTSDQEVLADYIDTFKVELSRVTTKRIVSFTILYKNRGRKYDGEYQVHLRNEPELELDNYQPPDTNKVVSQVKVTPPLVTITPDSSLNQGFHASVTGKYLTPADKRVAWTLSSSEAAFSITADSNGVNCTLVRSSGVEPQSSEFNVIATTTSGDISPSLSGSAIVRVKKVENVKIVTISGLNSKNADGLDSATLGGRVQFSPEVTGWNLTGADKKVTWKLEYTIKNGNTYGNYMPLTTYRDGQYTHVNPDIAYINGGSGTVFVGKEAKTNYKFRVTATALFPPYTGGYAFDEKEFGVYVNQTPFDESLLIRGCEINLKEYLESGAAYDPRNGYEGDSQDFSELPGAANDDAKRIVEIISITFKGASDAAYNEFIDFDPKTGILLFDVDAFKSNSAKEGMAFYTGINVAFEVKFINIRGEENTMTINLKFGAVKVHKDNPKTEYVVMSKGSTMDLTAYYENINIIKQSQIGVYVDGVKVANDGSGGTNRYLSGQLRLTDDRGATVFGNYNSAKNYHKTRVAVNTASTGYPTKAIPIRMTLDDYYLREKSANSYKEWNVYIANVQGQNVYIPGPNDTTSRAGGVYKNGESSPQSTVNINKNGTKWTMTYNNTTYTYNNTYNYWQR